MPAIYLQHCVSGLWSCESFNYHAGSKTCELSPCVFSHELGNLELRNSTDSSHYSVQVIQAPTVLLIIFLADASKFR